MAEIQERISKLNHLKCSACEAEQSAENINTYSTCDQCCGNPWISLYQLQPCKPRELINSNVNSMWRYQALLPVVNHDYIVSLGEGWTPIIALKSLGSKFGMHDLILKDESLNPTGSFKARGLSAAMSKAKELGVERCIIPTAGNAGVAAAAYGARAGIKTTVVMPTQAPASFQRACKLFGAELFLVDGSISDCGRFADSINYDGSFLNLSTMKEPYRLEGKKTLGYEIAEQLEFELPDVILYPTGGGTGLIGIWKAFSEILEMGWIKPPLPRMIAVQAASCQPIVEAMNSSQVLWSGSIKTIANGLEVPKPFARNLILQTIRESNGTAIAVNEDRIKDGLSMLAVTEGILAAPEGAALVAALDMLISSNVIRRDKRVLLLNTGHADKYLDSL